MRNRRLIAGAAPRPSGSSRFLGIAAVAVTVLLAPGDLLPAQQRPDRPNVLFIAVDDLRCNLSCMGDPIAKTPNLDRLAAGGVLFERAYIQMAICNASRSSIITGLRNDTIRVWGLTAHFRRARPDAVTLPQHFKNHGYRAVSIGKILHGTLPAGKDERSWSVPARLQNIDNRYRYVTEENLRFGGKKAAAVEAADLPEEKYIDGIVANLAVEELRTSAAGGKPFFLAVGFRKPHMPFAAPSKYFDLYRREQFTDDAWHKIYQAKSLPEGAPELAGHRCPEARGYRDIPDDGPIPEQKRAELRHGYYAATSFTDAQVGKVLDALEEAGLAGSTIVCLFSDHGFEIGDHGLWGKLTNYEIDTRIPLIVSAPWVAGGRKSRALVEAIDMYPTLVELAGLPMPTGLEGLSMAPLLDAPDRPWKQGALSQFYRPVDTYNLVKRAPQFMGYAIRTDRYRYVEWRTFGGDEVVARELYDHRTDPHETINVADQPERRQTVEQLSRLLAGGWRAALPAMPERHADGVSLVPLLEGGDALPPRSLGWNYPHGHRSTRTAGAATAYFSPQQATVPSCNARNTLPWAADMPSKTGMAWSGR